MLFRLQTAAGRAQAYAHSEAGAAKVRELEAMEDALRETIAEHSVELLEPCVANVLYSIDEMQGNLQDTDYDAQVERFKQKLTLKQKAAFNRLLRVKRKKEEEMLNELVGMQLRLEEIKKNFAMP